MTNTDKKANLERLVATAGNGKATIDFENLSDNGTITEAFGDTEINHATVWNPDGGKDFFRFVRGTWQYMGSK